MKQVRVLLLSLVATFVAIGLTGCAVPQPKPETRNISIEGSKTKTFEISDPDIKTDPFTGEGVTFSYEANKDLNLTKLIDIHVSTELSKTRNEYGVRDRDGATKKDRYEVAKNESGYLISFTNREPGWTEVHESVAYFNIETSFVAPNKFVISLPTKYVFQQGKAFDSPDSIIPPLRPLEVLEQIVVNVYNRVCSDIVDNLDNDSWTHTGEYAKLWDNFSSSNTFTKNKNINGDLYKLDIKIEPNRHRYSLASGEENSRYKPDSIKANFGFSEKTKNFIKNLHRDKEGRTVLAELKIVPYRDGSKIAYSIYANYKLDSSGKPISKSDIAKWEKMVIDIINK